MCPFNKEYKLFETFIKSLTWANKEEIAEIRERFKDASGDFEIMVTYPTPDAWNAAMQFCNNYNGCHAIGTPLTDGGVTYARAKFSTLKEARSFMEGIQRGSNQLITKNYKKDNYPDN